MDWFSLDTEKVREVTASEYSHDLYREAVAIKRRKKSSQKRKERKKYGKVKNKKKKNNQNKGKGGKSKSSSNDDQPLNKGPYGFEHPDVIDVRRGFL